MPRANHISGKVEVMCTIWKYTELLTPAVCSCTLWVGHLPKTIKQQQINEAFEDYGQVKSVDVS